MSAEWLLFWALGLSLLVIDASGLVRREVGRVWIMFTPALVVSLAPFLARLVKQSSRIIYLISGLLLLQAWGMELVLDTLW
jgi:hypothetical protein